MDARADRSARPDGGQTPTAAPTPPASVSTPRAQLDALRGAQNAKAADPDRLALPDGLEVPADLLALLHRPSTVSRLAAAGIETTRELLRLDEGERKFTPKTGPALWRMVEDLLAEHQPGVKLGCLADGAQAPATYSPPTLTALPGGRMSKYEQTQEALRQWAEGE